MHATRSTPVLSGNGHHPSPASASPRRRRPAVAVVAALVALGCALLFALLYRSADQRTPVLVVRHDVPAGRVLTADDLAVRGVAVDQDVKTLAASQASSVVGQRATVDLIGGSLLLPKQFGEPAGLDDNAGVIALALPEAATPALAPGDRVRVVDTGRTGADGAVMVLGDGRVTAVSSPDGSGKVSVSLEVDEAEAPDMVAAGAADHARLIRVPQS